MYDSTHSSENSGKYIASREEANDACKCPSSRHELSPLHGGNVPRRAHPARKKISKREVRRSGSGQGNTRRGRKRLNRLPKFSCCEFGRSRCSAQRRGERGCRREDEDDGCRHRGAGLMAARHGALHRVRLILGSATAVLTAHRCFCGGRLNGRSLLSPLVSVRSVRAETRDAASHPICF